MLRPMKTIRGSSATTTATDRSSGKTFGSTRPFPTTPVSPGRERLFDVVEQRHHSNIAKLNSAHRTSFVSFSDLGKSGSLTYPRWISAIEAGEALPAQTGSRDVLADAEALLGEIVEQLHRVSCTKIRKHRSNHMVLGSYVKQTTHSKGIWKRIAPYINALGP